MSTETELRSALRSRAAHAPVVDPEQLLADLARQPVPARSAAGRSPGRQWAIAGVAAGVVALAAVPVVLVVSGSGDDGRGTVGAGAPVVTVASTPTGTPTAPGTPAPSETPPTPAVTSPTDGIPFDPTPVKPVPLDSSWQRADGRSDVVVDPAAVVFSDDPILAYYQRAGQQLSVLAADGQAKDSSDPLWHTAVQVYLAGSGFDPSGIGDPTPVTVNGIARQFGTLPRLLDVTGPAQVPSLQWQVGDAWVVLQIDTPAVATADQLATAAARVDVHHGT